MKRLNVEFLKEKGINVEKYNKAYDINEKDFYDENNKLDYAGGVFYLLNEFIENGSDSDKVIKNSKCYDQYSGAQVQYAKGAYNNFKEEEEDES